MRSLNIAIAAMIVAVSAPAAAQFGYDGEQFVSAVEKRDGGKAGQLVSEHPTVINARNGKGDTALVIAAARGDYDWTAFLLNKGADPNLGGARGETPLIAASRVGFEDGVKWLLNGGAKVDGTNKMGETALIAAVHGRQLKIVKILLEEGADPDKRDTAAGYSAREYAARDTRSRQILQMIEAKKSDAGAGAK